MNHTAKRSISILLALILCLNLLSGLTLEADAASYVYNWGHRGTTATYLSDAAIAFYEKNQVSYEDWTALSGGTANTASQSTLYDELHSLMKGNHKTITSYNGTKDLFQYTDCQNGGGKISSFYSGLSIGPAWDSGSSWNREHTWPNSKGLEGSDEDDIMMLRPTATSENSSRGNTAYGASSGYYDPNSVSNGRYNLHGDVARIVLYVYVRWGNTGRMWGSSGVMENLDVLLSWMEEDPVDTWELGRNDSVQSITGTRNVFVDYPELAFLLFDQPVPGDMVTPSGKAAEETFRITATSNNPDWGTVAVSGKNINCTPAQGYRVAGYEVLSGSASLEQKGNIFVVTATDDCSVQINFEKRKGVKLSYLENGVTVSTADKLADDEITLPGLTGAAPEGYTFRGWLPYALAETAQTPDGLLVQGSKYILKGDTAFHAVYSRLDSTGTGSAEHFEAFNGQLVEGDYLIVSNGVAMKAELTGGGRLNYTSVSTVNGTVSQPDPSLIWHIAPLGDGYWTIYNKSTGTYAAGTGVKKKATLIASVTDYARWTPSGTGAYEFTNKAHAAANINSLLHLNPNYGFATYSAATGSANLLYKGNSGTTYYTTSTASYNITVTVSDPAMGSATVSGNVITVSPNTGYCIDSVTVSPETPYQISGNTITLRPTSDCQVTVVLRERLRYGIRYFENGRAGATEEKYEGESFVIAGPTFEAPEGYEFVGWVNTQTLYVEQIDENSPGFFQVGDVIPAGSMTTLAALYKSVHYTDEVLDIEAVSADPTMGTVSVLGQIVTVACAEGYQIQNVEIVSGEATFTREGSTIVVKPASDCQVLVSFEERTTAQVLFFENGKVVAEFARYPGETVTVPQFSGQLLKGYTFLGWAIGMDEGSDDPGPLMQSGDVVTVNGDLQISAVYYAGKYTTSMAPIPTVIALDAQELGDAASVWINGREYPVETVDGQLCVTFAQGVDPTNMVAYTYFAGDGADPHTQYPTGMKVWSVSLTEGAYVARREAGLDNLLQYSGCSIRIVGKKGIRMITSLTKDQKNALTGKGIDGYTLVEYGTLLGFASNFTAEAPLTLEHPDAKSNYAYKKGVADPVFAYSGNLVQYTNVLVGFSNDQCKEDIAMRPYIILQNAEGEQITLYGGVIYRSIGYIAYQNRSVFKPGTAAYDYVWEIIHHVYGDAYDADFKK